MTMPVILLATAAMLNSVDPVWLERARKEVPAEHQRLLDAGQSFDEQSTVVYVVSDEKKTKFAYRTIQYRTCATVDGGMAEKRGTPWDASIAPTVTIRCVNQQYRFALEGDAAKPAAFCLTNYSSRENSQGRPGSSIDRGSHSDPTNYLAIFAAMMRGDQELWSMTDLRWQPDTRRFYLSYHAAASSSAKSGRPNDPAMMELWIDPSEHWRVERYRVTEKKFTMNQDFEYGHVLNGVVFPQVIRIRSVSQSPLSESYSATTTIDYLKPATKTDRDFRLSAYGLPEPAEYASAGRSPPAYVWVMIAAGMMFALAVGFRALARRSASKE